MDRFDQLERAHALYLDLCSNVEHLVHAMELLLDGEIHSAHWALWMAGLSKVRPEEAGKVALIRRARERRFRSGAAQVSIFEGEQAT